MLMVFNVCEDYVQEFMGRQLLAMNVMWKYREQVHMRI